MKKYRKGPISSIFTLLVVVLIIIGSYFYFAVYVSEAKALRILRDDYRVNQKAICEKFMVGEDRCSDFVMCYADKAANTMPKNILVQFAKDIRDGKSQAIDSYDLVNGGELGGQCFAQLLTSSGDSGSNPTVSADDLNDSRHVILRDIGTFKYEEYFKNKTPIIHKGISRTEYNVTYRKDGKSYEVNVQVYASEADQKTYFDGHLLSLYASQGLINSQVISGVIVYESEPKASGEKLYAWAKGNHAFFLSQPTSSQVLFNAYFNK